MKLINGGVPERSIGTVLKTVEPQGSASSNLAASANLAALTGVCAPVKAFNHTAEAEWPKQPKLYASRCVSQIGAQQWTKENSAALK